MKSPHKAFGVFKDSKSGTEQLIDDLRTEAGNCRRDSPAHPNYIAGLLLLAADALTEECAQLKNVTAAIGKRVAADDDDDDDKAPGVVELGGPPVEKHRHRFVDENATKCACGAYKRGHAPVVPAAGGGA